MGKGCTITNKTRGLQLQISVNNFYQFVQSLKNLNKPQLNREHILVVGRRGKTRMLQDLDMKALKFLEI